MGQFFSFEKEHPRRRRASRYFWIVGLMVCGAEEPQRAQEETKYLMYASHSGLGNQLRALRNALLLAKMSNRTLVVPPPLHHYEIQREGKCERECMTELALKYYREVPGNFLEVLHVKDGPPVVPYSEAFARPKYDFSLLKCQVLETKIGVCDGEDWRPFFENPERLVMIASALIWPRGNWRNFGKKPLPTFHWNDASPLFASGHARLGTQSYSCLYVRHSDFFDEEFVTVKPDPRYPAEVRARGRDQGLRDIADRLAGADIHDRIYVASNVETKPICDHVVPRLFSECWSAEDVRPNSTNATDMMPLCEQAFLDMYMCSQATQPSHCFISNERAGGTFWQTIVDFKFADDATVKKSQRPKCTVINEIDHHSIQKQRHSS